MALINCPDCNKEVSSNAPACPGCGSPIATVTMKPEKGSYIPYTNQEASVLLSKKPKTSHLLHLVLSLLTVGFWVIVWIVVALSNHMECARIDKKIAKGKKYKGGPLSASEQGLI